MLLYLAAVAIYIIKPPEDPIANAIVLCLIALQIFFYVRAANESICLRKVFP